MNEFIRAVPLDDIHIRAGGTGRTVEAYAAIFDEPAEVQDQDGHYEESNDPGAFTRTIKHHGGRFPVIYNHGMTVAMTPSDRGSVPIGVSTDVRVDRRGVLTVSEYGRSELADEVLEAIRLGAVKAQSFGGRFIRSNPSRRPAGGYRRRPDGSLQSVRRLEVAMREFGPTPFPAFVGAAITSVRAQQLAAALLTAPAERRGELLAQLDAFATPLDDSDVVEPASADDDLADTSPSAPADGAEPVATPAEDPPAGRSRLIPLSTRVRAARIARGWE